MLSRLIPSSRSFLSRAVLSSSSLQKYSVGLLIPSSNETLFRRSFADNAATITGSKIPLEPSQKEMKGKPLDFATVKKMMASGDYSSRGHEPKAEAVVHKSDPLMDEAIDKAINEIRIQSVSWTEEKQEQFEAELDKAHHEGGEAAALAVMQKNLLQRTKFSDIVKNFGGWYPLLGLAAITAFSKELILLNEELLLAVNFVGVMGTIYFNYSDVILQQYYDDRDAFAKKQKELRKLKIDTNKVLFQSYANNTVAYSMLKDLKTEYNSLFEKKVKVTFARQRVAAHHAVTKKLDDIFARELEQEVRLRTYIQKAATSFVLDKYQKLPAAQKSVTLDNAIDRFGGAKADIKKDPVRQLYLEYFKNKEWEKTAKKSIK